MRLNKKAYKAQKKQIIENGALEIGYSGGIREVITMDETLDALEELRINGITFSDFEVSTEHYVITEVIRQMDDTRFEEVSEYFFNHLDMARAYCGYKS